MEEKWNDVVSEPMIAQPVYSSYTDVMSYLHSIYMLPEDKEKVAHRLTVEVTNPYLAKAYAKLDQLSQLRKDWDGEGGLPVSRYVMNNIKQVLLISDDADWKNWMISPDGNATLGLQSKETRALISLGRWEFSYFVKRNGKKYGESHVDFTPEVFLNTMRRIG